MIVISVSLRNNNFIFQKNGLPVWEQWHKRCLLLTAASLGALTSGLFAADSCLSGSTDTSFVAVASYLFLSADISFVSC